MNLEQQYPILVKLLSVISAKDLFGNRGGDFRSGAGEHFSDCCRVVNAQRHRLAERSQSVLSVFEKSPF